MGPKETKEEVVLEDVNFTVVATVVMDNGVGVDIEDISIESPYTYSIPVNMKDLTQGTIEALYELAQVADEAAYDESEEQAQEDWA